MLFPEGVSTYARDIDGLFYLILGVIALWFAASMGALIAFCVLYRRRPGLAAAHVRGESWRELRWVLVPAALVLLFDLGIETAGGKAWDRIKRDPPPAELQLRGTARQFNWFFTYPGPDGRMQTEDDLTLQNELHVPVGRTVGMDFQAEDVIHSFFIPSARIKQDVIPGRTARILFTIAKPGRYEIACAELCGYGHYGMRGVLVAHPEEEFRAWSAKAGKEGDTP